MKKRTVREFNYGSELWPLVDAWATAEGDFKLESSKDGFRVYSRGRWLFLAPTHLEIRQQGKQVVLQTWLRADFYMTMRLFTGRAPEGGLESGGLSAWIQRRRARAAINRLLVKLGQPLIR